jgi:hypothetical protein
MADDQSQKPYRASEPPVRGPAKAHGSDPLAELARLIGQTDPFAEFGRETARRAPAPQPTERSDADTQPVRSPYAPRSGDPRSFAAPQNLEGSGYYTARSTPSEQSVAGAQSYSGQDYGRQDFGDLPLSAEADPYQPEQEEHGYLPGQADYRQEGYEHDAAHPAEEGYYDDAPPSRRRLGVMAIAAVVALAVIGTAGAFGYRALFGSSGSGQPPPVIKADAGPSKVVPATTGKDAQSGKLIVDRLNDRGQSEKLVSREEQPIDKPATAALMQSAPQSAQQSALGSGVIANEPKKVRTIAIHPDQPVVAEAAPPAPPLAAAPPARPTPAPPPAKPAAPPARAAADTSTADTEQDPAPPPAARPAPPARQAAPASGNAPLSLSPDAAAARAPARPPAAPPARTASVAAPAQVAPAAATASTGASTGSGNFVQVSSQRSEAEAQAAFRSLQAKYPNQLGGRQPQIHKVDLGAKGTFYRAMVGPFANASEAGELCSSLKAAGGQCLIQRN